MKHPITGSQLSGHGYVKARLKEEPKGWFPLILRPVQRCYCTTRDEEITSTVCVECAESWTYDFEVTFETTAAGRWLAKNMRRRNN